MGYAVLLVIMAGIDIYVAYIIISRLSSRQYTDVSSQSLRDSDLPSISVCIPARNETHAMTTCLERLVQVDYPKLEILVLDDESIDDTSVLIKSFAHAGIRFIDGSKLSSGWQGKNFALSELAGEASGKYLLFMDVDTVIDRETILKLINTIRHNDYDMISVMPFRDDNWTISTLFSTMRFFWDILQSSSNSPRGVSNLWMIKSVVFSSTMESHPELRASLQFETDIARNLDDNKYRLLIDGGVYGVRYEKKWTSQVETSIRLLYPRFGRSKLKALSVIFFLVIASLPYVIWPLYLPLLGVILAQFIISIIYLRRIWRRYKIIGSLILPVILLQEVGLIVISVYKYMRGTVTWKGRPVRVVGPETEFK